jgi:hypothetical protein
MVRRWDVHVIDAEKTIRVPLPLPGTVLLVMADGEAWTYMPIPREFLADAEVGIGDVLLEQLDDSLAMLREQRREHT